MSLFSNARYNPVYRRRPAMTRSGPLMATIAPWISLYLAAIMIIMFALIGVSMFAIHLRPAPADPHPNYGDKHRPPQFVDIRPGGVSDVRHRSGCIC